MVWIGGLGYDVAMALVEWARVGVHDPAVDPSPPGACPHGAGYTAELEPAERFDVPVTEKAPYELDVAVGVECHRAIGQGDALDRPSADLVDEVVGVILGDESPAELAQERFVKFVDQPLEPVHLYSFESQCPRRYDGELGGKYTYWQLSSP